MPLYQTTAIVLARTNFGEADRILRVLTPTHGKISIIAKGIRRIKSRTAGHLELLAETNLVLSKGRNLDLVTSARLAYYPHNLAQDYGRLSLAFLLAQLTDRLTLEDHPASATFTACQEAIRAVDSGASGSLPELWYKLRLLQIGGYVPDLTACITCGRADPDLAYAFSPDRGGILCPSDATPGDLPISASAIKLWRLLSVTTYHIASRVEGAAAMAESTLPIVDRFYEYHLGRSFHVVSAV